MKLEMAESLVCSWMRHIQHCQLVQCNWAPSGTWELHDYEYLLSCMEKVDEFFIRKYGYSVFKKSSLSQLLQQAEIDVVGSAHLSGKNHIYAAEVAFHSAGVNYGSTTETVTRVIKKFVRAAFCLRGYFDANEYSIVFIAPKINPSTMDAFTPVLKDLRELASQIDLPSQFDIIANDRFKDEILFPMIRMENDYTDTSELFMRSIQLRDMFFEKGIPEQKTDSPEKKNAQMKSSPKKEAITSKNKAHDRIPIWASNSGNYNHKMLRAFFHLEEVNGEVTKTALKQCCSDPSKPDMYIEKFDGHFASMKTDAGNSHGKVFETVRDTVIIWQPVYSRLMEYKQYFV